MEKIWHQRYPKNVPKTIYYPDVPLTHFLVEASREFPKNDVIYFEGKRMTYATLLDQVYRFANGLRNLGLKKGDRVSIMLPNSPQAVIAYYGVLFVGGIVVQTNPMYTEREVEYQINDSQSETIICLDLLYPRIRNVREKTSLKRVIVTSIKEYLPFPKNWLYTLKMSKELKEINIAADKEVIQFSSLIQESTPEKVESCCTSSDEMALIQYTGGTTGFPKGAMLSHRNLIANCCQASAWMYRVQRGNTKILGVLPFFHVYGMTVVMNFSVYLAGTMILVPRFDRNLILKLITKHRPTIFPGAPTMYVGLINHPYISRYDLSSIDACISGSAPLPLEVQESFEKLTGGRLVEGYGSSETSPVTHGNLIWEREKNATIGVPWPDTDARIVDMDTGEELSQGGIGELQVKGPQVMKGYWNRPEETAKVLNNGWYSTGDIAIMDEQGYFYILDRKKDMILAGGFNIYPREVEEVLFEHPAISDAAVIGVPDTYRGETVKAFIVIKSGHQVTDEELDVFCRERLASYKIPRMFEVREELPKTAVGKVLRRQLQEEEKLKKVPCEV